MMNGIQEESLGMLEPFRNPSEVVGTYEHVIWRHGSWWMTYYRCIQPTEVLWMDSDEAPKS